MYKMEIKYNENLKENGLYATRSYLKNECIFTLSGEKFDRPKRETIYVGNGVHILNEFGMFMNHSFQPTTYIDGYNVVALNDIKEGDELNFNYNINEIEMASPFECEGCAVNGQRKN